MIFDHTWCFEIVMLGAYGSTRHGRCGQGAVTRLLMPWVRVLVGFSRIIPTSFLPVVLGQVPI